MPRGGGVTVALVLLFTLAGAAASNAAAEWSASKLAQACAKRQTGDCAVFVRGVLDRYHELIASHCPRQAVPFGDLVAAVTARLAKEPPGEDRAASGLILETIKGRYRCGW
jgi:hypothetical protein